MRKNSVPRKVGYFFINFKLKINDKAHALLKKMSQKRGVPMTYIVRGYIYRGLHQDLKKEREENETN